MNHKLENALLIGAAVLITSTFGVLAYVGACSFPLRFMAVILAVAIVALTVLIVLKTPKLPKIERDQ